MIENINIKYTKKDNNWFCKECNGEIYSSKKPYKLICSCISRINQINLYSNYLINYYYVVNDQYICKKCNLNIKSQREKHALSCIGNGTKRKNEAKEFIRANFSNKCDMGCGNDAEFFYKSGKAYCCKLGAKCPVKVESDRNKKIGINPWAEKQHPKGMLGKVAYNKGLTKETSDIVKKNGLAIKKSFELYGDQRKKKNHTEESRKKISRTMKDDYKKGREPVCGRSKKYKHSSPIAGDISVDGTWELAFAQILDKIGVNWIRNKKRFDYINLEGEESTYQPDFFVYDWDAFIEVKGYQTDLDDCKWKQFNEPLLIVKKTHIRKIKQWLKDDRSVNKEEIYDLIKESTKERNYNNINK